MKKTTKIAMNKSNDDKLVYFISLRMPEGASPIKSINREGELDYCGSRNSRAPSLSKGFTILCSFMTAKSLPNFFHI